MPHADTLFSQMDSYASAKERFESRLAEAMSTRIPGWHRLCVQVNADGLLERVNLELAENMIGIATVENLSNGG